MSEADYMDECEHAGRWDEENRTLATHEVVGFRNRKLFSGSRADCWSYRQSHGGFVRAKKGED